jgi:UDP-glucuronate decarboxylase
MEQVSPYIVANKRILVTGSAGFLGSHLCKALLLRNNEVVGLDNFCSGSRANVAEFLSRPAFQLVQHDVRERFVGEFDLIFHLACPASPPIYQRDPIATAETCVLGALNMLRLATETGARIVFTSTSEVYGDPEQHPQTEHYRGSVNPIGPRACYDEGKRMAEALFFDFQRQHGVDIKVVRIFNTYGPRMNPEDGRVVSNFIVQALRGDDITIYGDGSQTRSFCYVDDMIRGLMGMAAAPRNFSGPVNLGNPGEFTIGELAELVLEITGSRSRIIHAPLPADDPRQRRPDISLARAALDWLPTVDLRQGLALTAAHFEQVLCDAYADAAQ